eukprot:GHRR01015655.1.p1 GENE.GHRR01015655.1~~GHRR01015655.1.p1  ORF type:complete len:109 (+),score=29.38 GHRR01015655.1:99-425(+)
MALQAQAIKHITCLKTQQCKLAFKPAKLQKLICNARAAGDKQELGLLHQCATTMLAAATAALPLSVSPVLQTPPAHALLTAGDPIKNAQAILRYALPINNKPIRQIQV